MIVRELPIISDPSQSFTTTLSGRRCDFLVNYNAVSDRWAFDLSIDSILVVAGRRIVSGVDLIKPFAIGIGAIVAAPWGDADDNPGRTQLPAGLVRLFHIEAEPA